MAKEHEEFIANFLDANEKKAYLGSELKTILKNRYSELTDNNCRRIIKKAVDTNRINSSFPLVFEKNQYAYYSKKSNYDYRLFAEVIKKYKSALHRVIYALERNGGILTFQEVQKISGATSQETAHSVSFDSILKDLKVLNIVNEQEVDGIKFVIQNKSKSVCDDIHTYIQKLENKTLVLKLILNWLVRTNLIDSKQLCYVGEKNKYRGIERNGEVWDAWGFSNTVGIGKSERAFQTMVLVDCLEQNEYQEYDFQGFKQRIDRVIFSTKNQHRKVLPIVIANKFSPAARNLIKENCYLSYSISAILGENAVMTVSEFNAYAKEIEDKIKRKERDIQYQIKESLNTINSTGNRINYGNLVGKLFEYLMFPVLQEIYGKNAIITHSYKGKVSGKEFECDYLIETKDENIIVELKGYKRDNVILKGEFNSKTGKYAKNSILWFLDHNFKLCSEVLGRRKMNKFCYITTADIAADAKTVLISKKKNKPLKLACYYTYDTLIELLNQYNLKEEKEIIQQFFV